MADAHKNDQVWPEGGCRSSGLSFSIYNYQSIGSKYRREAAHYWMRPALQELLRDSHLGCRIALILPGTDEFLSLSNS